MFGYSMCLTDDKPLNKIKTFTTTVFSNDEYRFTN